MIDDGNGQLAGLFLTLVRDAYYIGTIIEVEKTDEINLAVKN